MSGEHQERRSDDRSTHALLQELDRKVSEHIAKEPEVMADAIDRAVAKTVEMLVPNADADGHKEYHQALIEAAEAQRKAADEQAEFWRNARKELLQAIVHGGIKALAKAFWLLVVVGLAAWFGWDRVEKWWSLL